MTSPLTPTAADVQKLDDVQLRQLLIRLCDAELAAANRSNAGLTAGGHQNASDGGLDVRVESEGGGVSYLRAFPVGLQAKAESMPPSKIFSEMRPGGKDRPALAELAERGGTYIIASGRDDCSDSMLKTRLAEMKTAAATLAHAERLVLDFYDSDRLARWAASRPGVGLWLQKQAGRPAGGWRGLDSWSAPNQSLDSAYLLDPTARAYFDDRPEPQSTESALGRLRETLTVPKACVRLVGLSGMGKTRFAQALFDPRISGTTALSVDLAVYADAGASLEVLPQIMANQLVERHSRAVLIVDNCPASEHRWLTQIVERAESQISLLTIDFDIGDERLPSTRSVRLEPAGGDVIERLLRQRAPDLSRPDRNRIVEFSGGNARVALELAKTANGQSLAELRDEELMDRLFLTVRRQPDEALRRVARATALVNAFETGEPAGEVPVLARLANVDISTFYDKLTDLLDRGLAQKRGKQRAVLPQALAARLADEAFRRAAPGAIEAALVQDGPARLRTSFTKRLGLLHQNADAVALAERLLTSGGRYAITTFADEEVWEGFSNLAPLAAKHALDLLVKAIDEADPEDEHFRWRLKEKAGRLLLALAYESDMFDRALAALIKLSGLLPGQRDEVLRSAIVSLFQGASSGTMAPAVHRQETIKRLLASPDEEDRKLGLDGLGAALRVEMQNHELVPTFGARPRSTGWRPSDDTEWRTWFEAAIAIAVALEEPLDAQFRPRLALALGAIIKIKILRSLALSTFAQLGGDCFWRDGWFAVCSRLNSLQRRKAKAPQELVSLELVMRPRTRDDEYEAWIRGDSQQWREPFDSDMGHNGHFYARQRKFGFEVASEVLSRAPLVRRIVADAGVHGIEFGAGLAEGTQDLEGGWRELVNAFTGASASARNVTALTGYILGAKQQSNCVTHWLDAASEDEALRPWVVHLENACGPIGADGAMRILTSLEAGSAKVGTFDQLQYGKATHSIPNPILSQIVRALVARDGGLERAVDVLAMRYFGADETPLDDTLIATGQSVLAAIAESPEIEARSFNIGTIAKLCLNCEAAAPIAATMVRRIISPSPGSLPSIESAQLVGTILMIHPAVALDAVFEARESISPIQCDWILGGHDDDDAENQRPLNLVPFEIMQAWVSADPAKRAPFIAEHIAYFDLVDAEMVWTPAALWLMNLPGFEGAVLAEIEHRFHVGSWTGSEESRYVKRLDLVKALRADGNSTIQTWAEQAKGKLEGWIAESERRDRERTERFE